MKILTEPIGSIPRPKYLVEALQSFAQQQINESQLSELYNLQIWRSITELC